MLMSLSRITNWPTGSLQLSDINNIETISTGRRQHIIIIIIIISLFQALSP